MARALLVLKKYGVEHKVLYDDIIHELENRKKTSHEKEKLREKKKELKEKWYIMPFYKVLF